MNREAPLNGGISLDRPEPGVRYAGKLVRDMTDEELAGHIQKAAIEMQAAQMNMQQAVMDHATRMAIANVLAFEHERRTKKIRVVSVLQS